MTGITRCPHCTKELGVPYGTLETAAVECPLCKRSFGLRQTYPGNLPTIIVTNSVGPSIREENQNTGRGLPADVVPVIKQEGVLAGEAGNNFDPRREHNEDAPAFSHQALSPLFTPSLASGGAIASKKRRSSSPFVHLFGIVFFGIVGLTLGLGVLCFFGKASPIIQLLPENAFKVWLQEVNQPDIGEHQ